MWILYSLIDSAIVVYETYVDELRTADREALWQDYRVIGRLFGLRAAQMPADYPELVAYGRRMLDGDELQVGAWARRRARPSAGAPRRSGRGSSRRANLASAAAR